MRKARAGMLLLCATLALGAPPGRAEPAPDTTRVPRYFPPLAYPPLDPPLRLTGTFGELRGGHFHAGLDLSTGEEVGKPVYASLPGFVVRVRASGVGYGRSLYVETDDGRILVYGHLDAYDAPLAAYVDSAQGASGQYEQDLWPARERFRVAPGQRLGWSGRSGTGPPHLHFEIRRGDVAYNPLLAGVTVEDEVAPVIRSVTLDPVDEASRVDGGSAPVTKPVAGAAAAFHLAGGARVQVEALDARANGRLTMAPWRTRVTRDDGAWRECRFDSVSWAEGMSEVDGVYDRGLRAPSAPASVLVWPGGELSSSVQSGAPGPLRLVEQGRGSAARGRPGERATRLQVEVEDARGNRATASVLLEPGAPPAGPIARFDSARVAALDSSWSARARGAPRRRIWAWDAMRETPAGRLRDFTWNVKSADLPARDPVRAVVRGRVADAGELAGASEELSIHPVLEPVLHPFRMTVRAKGRPDPRLGLYRNTGEGWEWIGAEVDARRRTVSGETRRLGRFALFRDLEAPRIALRAPPRRVPATPYPSWALEAGLEEHGSGVVARASYFTVDGARVPSEWDEVEGTLRWRPLHPPAAGEHSIEVVAVDRAGNVRRQHGTFVLD